MKKLFTILSICIFMTGCNQETEMKSYPEMEEFYKESCSWDTINKDSLKNFVDKVNVFIYYNPRAKTDPLLPMIQKNVDAVATRFTIEIDTAWAGHIYINF